MNKESMLFRTHEIKSRILKKSQHDPKQSLFFFIKDDNFQKFKEVLEKKKLNLEETDDEGNTLLNVAVQCNSYSIANYLINNGANVNTQNVRKYFNLFFCRIN
jgi:ankyrin repeat protein